MEQDAVGFAQRTSGRRIVVEDESPFIHFRQEIASQKVIADRGENHDSTNCDYYQEWPLHDLSHRVSVERDDLLEESAQLRLCGRQQSRFIRSHARFFLRLSSCLFPHEIQAECRCPSKCEEERCEE